jgi:hypothetical protein
MLSFHIKKEEHLDAIEWPPNVFFNLFLSFLSSSCFPMHFIPHLEKRRVGGHLMFKKINKKNPPNNQGEASNGCMMYFL